MKTQEDMNCFCEEQERLEASVKGAWQAYMQAMQNYDEHRMRLNVTYGSDGATTCLDNEKVKR